MMIASIIVLQILLFAGLIYVFRRLITQDVTSATRHLEELSQDYNEKEKKINKLLDEAEAKADELIIQAQTEAGNQKSQILEEAQKEKEKIFLDARTHSEEIIQQAERARQQLLSEIEERIAKEAAIKAGELIQHTLPEEFRKLVHSHWVEDLIEGGLTRPEHLHIPEDATEIGITSAFALDDSQRKRIIKKLKDILGRELTIKEKVDPGEVAGVVINIGSLVLDGSLKNKIREKAR